MPGSPQLFVQVLRWRRTDYAHDTLRLMLLFYTGTGELGATKALDSCADTLTSTTILFIYICLYGDGEAF
jgi:hypothetical protein